MKIQKTVTINGKRYTGKQLRDYAIASGTPTAAAAEAVKMAGEWETPFELYTEVNGKTVALRFREEHGGLYSPVTAPENADTVTVFLDGFFTGSRYKVLWI